MPNNLIIIFAMILMCGFLFSKRIRTSKIWHATVTPLASIIGSGFLVSAPLLILTTGKLAPIAMTIIVITAFALGSSIRLNILSVESKLTSNTKQNKPIQRIEAISKPILGIAYVISVVFYIKLLSAFLLRGLNTHAPILENLFATSILLFIGITGKRRGLSRLESLETYSVNLKLSIIVALILGCIYFNTALYFHGKWELLIYPHDTLKPTLQKLLGMLIIIQGFETSRYLRTAYSKNIRIQTMKKAQIISGLIYVSFITVVMVGFNAINTINETTIIDVSRTIAPILPLLLTIAAVMSQFSAAIADTIGSGGLLVEALSHKIKTNTVYLIITLLGILLVWSTNIYKIITIASKAFAIYYALQLFLSMLILSREKPSLTVHLKRLGYSILMLLMALTIFLGIPVDSV